jgi:hypothetical protein
MGEAEASQVFFGYVPSAIYPARMRNEPGNGKGKASTMTVHN